MMLCGTFEHKSFKMGGFLGSTNTTLGHEKENLVQFVANEFSGTVPQLKAWNGSASGSQCSGQRDLLVR